ncbi:C40 family peptidase [Rhodococcus sp. D2-41]|nr:C40 family peptidase [Rhodococcus sp. D2-41]
MAQTLSIPGIGNFDLPDLPAAPQLPPAPQLPTIPALPTIPGLPAQVLPDLHAPAVPRPESDGQRALAAAESKVGSPYVWGASGPSAFDCSGLVQWAYRQIGVAVPRTTYAQANAGAAVSEADLQPGDVVLFDDGGHAGLYAGNNTVVHAPTSGESVKYSPLHSMTFFAARRF